MELIQEQKLFQEIVQEAWGNAEFKNNLVTNPIATIEEFTGGELNIPEGKSIVVNDQTDVSKIFLNIPSNLNLDDLELNEEQLEIVSGGGNNPEEHNGYTWDVFVAHMTGFINIFK